MTSECYTMALSRSQKVVKVWTDGSRFQLDAILILHYLLWLDNLLLSSLHTTGTQSENMTEV